MTSEHEQVLNEIAAKSKCRMIDGLSIRFVAPVIIACLMAASSAAQTARDVRGAAAVEPLQNEPPAKIIIDPPLAEPLSRGRVVIQYRTENLHIVPVFGPAALAVSPRVGHIHVTVDDAPWVWADASGEPVVLNGLPPGPHTIRLELETANHQRLDQGAVMFTVPTAPNGASAAARTAQTNQRRRSSSMRLWQKRCRAACCSFNIAPRTCTLCRSLGRRRSQWFPRLGTST